MHAFTALAVLELFFRGVSGVSSSSSRAMFGAACSYCSRSIHDRVSGAEHSATTLSGTTPVISLLCKLKYLSFDKSPRNGGMLPVSSLPNKFNSRKSVRLAKDSGMVPVSLLFAKYNFCKRVSLPSVGGIDPTKSLS